MAILAIPLPSSARLVFYGELVAISYRFVQIMDDNTLLVKKDGNKANQFTNVIINNYLEVRILSDEIVKTLTNRTSCDLNRHLVIGVVT